MPFSKTLAEQNRIRKDTSNPNSATPNLLVQISNTSCCGTPTCKKGGYPRGRSLRMRILKLAELREMEIDLVARGLIEWKRMVGRKSFKIKSLQYGNDDCIPFIYQAWLIHFPLGTDLLTQKIEPTITAKSKSTAPSEKRYGEQIIQFTGSGKEYFGIWIVNVILSIISIGIYSAWAKVRRETYFKNKTTISDIGFGYHATGLQIFKGRVIAFIALVVINVASTFVPLISVAMVIAIIFLLPWILNNSMRFSARMTSYRNIRFNWHGTYWKTFWFFVIAPVFSFISFGILMPLISKSYYTYFARSHDYVI